MHQIRFPLGLRPRPRWGSLQRSPKPLAVFKGPTSKGKGEGKERGGYGWKREGKGGESSPPPSVGESGASDVDLSNELKLFCWR